MEVLTIMSFAKKLKALRSENKVTQRQLAELLGIGRPTIAGYETKGKQPDFDKVIEIADYFNVSIDYLLGRSPIRTPYSKDLIESTKSHNNLDVSGLPADDIEKVKEYIELLRQKHNKDKS
jgi:transcriptional regulator with XRE-family HTH domain